MAHWDPADQGKKVYIGNLSEKATARDIEEMFAGCGQIRSTWVARNPPGFAFVTFEDKRDAADSVKQFDGTSYMGKSIRVELARGPRRGANEDRGGGAPRDYERGGRRDRDHDRNDRGGGGGGRERRSPSYRNERRSPSYSPYNRRGRRRNDNEEDESEYDRRKRRDRSRSHERDRDDFDRGRGGYEDRDRGYDDRDRDRGRTDDRYDRR
ncbi:unnamed protein product [Vitrella brassicaformis CCMP3155]|uniref:RRM domain-containing protein n=1 Tax=Vitrella brassicaformis (strain CCMP3155) TaxID=1169540 RepID=A0A0G4FHL0_VITBC|nr:unnamed protein product [Vitrella brassicaformis CCMP3155]|mmetsp:Transcript_15215/g.36219  ORF Transcript_15215/g.36219 Transcript_15215/m.36219 type:complete len:210 (-) Transcript_15215:266-895(-)|eukprot:CEM13006.1 unnamed protein product [Vitrella brassicaformis CCMP3155]